ncbi:MAG: MFS transporter [Alicyclobacillaceae bacterium]|nr:MFS transporter [Alicyclobacillaceae bacterium]
MLSLFRNRFVVIILLSGLFLQIGIWIRNFGVLLFVMDKTHGDAFAVSMISVAEFAPIFIFSFVGGTFADRWRPKRTMVLCDFLSAVSILLVLLALSFGTWRAVFFATVASSILSQFSQPSGMRLFKLHVPEHLMQAGMSIYQTLFAVFMILGPMLGTFVYQNTGIELSIAIMGAAFLASAAVLTMLPPDRMEKTVKPLAEIGREMLSGFRYVLKNRVLSALGGGFLAAGLGLGLIQPLGIFIVTERLGLPKEDLQWFMADNGAAMIVGGVLSMAFAKRILPQRLLTAGMLVNAVTFSIIGLSTHLSVSLTAQFFGGLMLPGIQIGINTMILRHAEASFIGRVNGILNPLFMGGMVITMSCAGWLKQLSSLVFIYLAAGLLFLVGILVMWPIHRSYPAARTGETHPANP